MLVNIDVCLYHVCVCVCLCAKLKPSLGRGKQDVLLAVVPSRPPVIAITCTTELSLFSLDGTRLPVATASRRRWRRSAENTPSIQYSEDEDEDDDDKEATPQVPVEGHERDIRCLAASPAGDMVATG